MDVHIPRAITNGLRRRGVEVITAQEDGTAELDDPPLLDRPTELNRPLYSQDDDLLAEAHRRQRSGESFSGVIYSHQLRSLVGGVSMTSYSSQRRSSRKTSRTASSSSRSDYRIQPPYSFSNNSPVTFPNLCGLVRLPKPRRK
jgi:hypothetical protein